MLTWGKKILDVTVIDEVSSPPLLQTLKLFFPTQEGVPLTQFYMK